MLAAMGPDAPPVLHTLHWDLAKHRELYSTVEGGGRVFVNGVSFRPAHRRAGDATRDEHRARSPRDPARRGRASRARAAAQSAGSTRST
jgi:hypothetical protein